MITGKNQYHQLPAFAATAAKVNHSFKNVIIVLILPST
jgi:hypothetical protein